MRLDRRARNFALLAAGLCLPAADPSLALQTYGTVASPRVECVRKKLQETFRVQVIVLPEAKLPEDAFHAPRNRYRGTVLLDALERSTPRTHIRVLGLTDKDISVTKGAIPDWGVFGVAYLGYRPAVISTFRLGRNGSTETMLRERLARVALHEVGHTFGLPHCPTPRCLMEDACGTISSVDRSTGRFCEACSKRLDHRLR